MEFLHLRQSYQEEGMKCSRFTGTFPMDKSFLVFYDRPRPRPTTGNEVHISTDAGGLSLRPSCPIPPRSTSTPACLLHTPALRHCRRRKTPERERERERELKEGLFALLPSSSFLRSYLRRVHVRVRRPIARHQAASCRLDVWKGSHRPKLQLR